MPSLTAQVYVQSLLLLFFTLFVMTYYGGNYGRRSLLLMSPFTLHISLGRYMLMALTALLESLPCPVILMSWAILSLPTLGWCVLSPFVLLFLQNFSVCFSH